jgi:PAS domain-containing protein
MVSKQGMKRTCLVCHTAFEPADDDPAITQGICEQCSGGFVAPASAVTLGEFLDQLGVPVLLMDDDVRVAGYNRAARELLGCRSQTLDGRLAGEVIECKNAGLPGGCGQTENCKGCAIRHAIATTHQTGESRRNVLARQLGKLISTEKIGRFVLLRIDEP